jgi:type IV secretion system protein VirB1
MLAAATFLSLAMQCAPSVHPDTSSDIARVESGFNPLVIGVVGQSKGIFPKTLDDAIAHAKQLQVKGKNFSVGLMQINKSNFSRYGVTAEKLFDPCTNLKVYEQIIKDCYIRGGTLQRALSCYYSGNFNTGKQKESQFADTSYVGRIGYVADDYAVPSTKADKNGEEKQQQPAADQPPPSFESWDVLRQYPRPVVPGQKAPESSTPPSTTEGKNVS